ncbi:long-chain acyl-CoA synthetase [Methylophilaceae bacterium]|nr:long-chain acyl-CoA synthetase [Methylophilaceae bacterium]
MQPGIILRAIQGHAAGNPDRIALQGAHGTLTYAELAFEIERMQKRFISGSTCVLGLAVENCPAWAVTDLAAMASGCPVVPLPAFFSAEQVVHAIRDAGINQLVTDQPIVMEHLLQSNGFRVASRQRYQAAERWLTQFTLADPAERKLPQAAAKVTYTSGTTGNPKGVCLGLQAIEQVASSLLSATEARPEDRHLSILPFPTLLENIAGLYVPLLAGARSVILPSHQVGLNGATGLEPQKMLQAIVMAKATTLVLTPELLKALVMMAEAGAAIPDTLRFIAVGGATVSHALLERAARAGLPVFEGYGLSECCSVVAVNTPGAHLEGSVGKPLPHVQIRFADDGEILVAGSTMLGHTGMADTEYGNRFWPTGDIGYMDDAGYLYISGRKKNVFITSFGRNVSPEWVESQLAQSPKIAQAALFGEARPWNTALIVPAAGTTSADVDQVINTVNAGLPDYASVRHWLFATAPFTTGNRQMTPNFRLRRDVIWQAYAARINALYEEASDVCI